MAEKRDQDSARLEFRVDAVAKAFRREARVPEVDLKTLYNAIVAGSGAAGGMAAHVLTSHGLKVC
jgi:NADPH-dependent 2,4-dienoyl-CoA reductase/sulfur reductase-like enzyme